MSNIMLVSSFVELQATLIYVTHNSMSYYNIVLYTFKQLGILAPFTLIAMESPVFEKKTVYFL